MNTEYIEKMARSEWDRSPALRGEFLNEFAIYRAYRVATETGRAKILGRQVTTTKTAQAPAATASPVYGHTAEVEDAARSEWASGSEFMRARFWNKFEVFLDYKSAVAAGLSFSLDGKTQTCDIAGRDRWFNKEEHDDVEREEID